MLAILEHESFSKRLGAGLLPSKKVLTVKVDGSIAIQINLADNLGNFFIRDAGIRLAHHTAEFLGGDVATTVLILQDLST